LPVASEEYPVVGGQVTFWLLFGPKVGLLSAVFCDECFGGVQLLEIVDLRLRESQSMVGFDVEPSRRGLGIEGDVAGGCLQHCNPGAVVEGGVEVAKEGQIG